jgi:hypothetical protein
VRHHLLLEKIAARVDDDAVMGLLKKILKSSGSRGVPQGGVISPLLSNIYLNEVDRMLQRTREVTCHEGWTAIEYCRWADDIVVRVDSHPRHGWLFKAVQKRPWEEFDKLQVEWNQEKSRVVDLERGECFGFLGFDLKRRSGDSWPRPDRAVASAGRGGVVAGCTTGWDSSGRTRSNGSQREQRLQHDRSHNPWCEVSRRV